jgi:hypothetical protein
MQEPNIPPFFQTISKAESPLSFLETKHPPGALSDKSYYQYHSTLPGTSQLSVPLLLRLVHRRRRRDRPRDLVVFRIALTRHAAPGPE